MPEPSVAAYVLLLDELSLTLNNKEGIPLPRAVDGAPLADMGIYFPSTGRTFLAVSKLDGPALGS